MTDILPTKPILKLIWPDDSYVGVGTKFGDYQAIVSTIVPVVRSGGLGPAQWYEIHSDVRGVIGEVNAAYLSAIVYGQTIEAPS